MIKRDAIVGIVMFLVILSGTAWAGEAIPVSPDAVTQQSCPTFSWSASEGAQSYRIEVYEQIIGDNVERDAMSLMAVPVVARAIPAPALSWTPSTGECLSRGKSYAWYVEGINTKGEGQWSEGRIFMIENAALTLDQADAVKDVVKEYLGSTVSASSAPAGAVTSTSTKTASGLITPMAAVETATNTCLGLNTGSCGPNWNTFIGAQAGQNNTGSANTFVGYNAGNANTSAINNTFIGQGAGWQNTTGHDNTFIGNGAGIYATTGSQSTYIGTDAGAASYGANGARNTADNNSFLGYRSGFSNTSGAYNSFLGVQAGYSNTTGYVNSFLGYQAGYTNSTGWSNVFLGYTAGYSNNTGYGNAFVGNIAGYSNTTGYQNIILGMEAGFSNNTGYGNVFLGYSAGYSNITGHDNVFLGKRAGYGETGSNKLYVDNCFAGVIFCSQPLIYGEFDNRLVRIDGRLEMVTVATPSDLRYKKEVRALESPLEKVLKLQGVTYEWDMDKVNGAGYKDGKQIGLIAQEVEVVFPEVVHTNSAGYKTLSYDKLVPVLIEAVKEQEAQFRASLKEKDARIERLERALQQIEQRLAGGETSWERIAMQ